MNVFGTTNVSVNAKLKGKTSTMSELSMPKILVDTIRNCVAKRWERDILVFRMCNNNID